MTTIDVIKTGRKFKVFLSGIRSSIEVSSCVEIEIVFEALLEMRFIGACFNAD